MNPDLERAFSLLAQARITARNNGVKFSPDEEEAFIREETQGKYGLSDIGNTGAGRVTAVAQGALFNWADELAGLFSKEFGEKVRIRGEAFRKARPKEAFALELLGGLAVPGVGTAKTAARGAVGVGKGILRSTAFGGGAGALAGAGAADSGYRREGAGIGAVSGAAVGGTLSTAVGGFRRFLSSKMKARRLRGELVKGAGGAASIRSRAAELSEVSPDVTVADAAPTLRGAAERMLSEFPELYADVQNRIAARQAQANKRFAKRFAQTRPSEVPAERLSRMRASTRDWAASDVGFEGLRQAYKKLPNPDAFVNYFKQPNIKSLWRQAQKVGLVGMDVPFPANLAKEQAKIPSFANVHELIQGLDKAVRSKFQSPGQKQLARQMSDVVDFLKGELGSQVPEAAPVFAEYATRMGREKGLQLGRDIFRATPNKLPDLVVKFRSMAPEAQFEARLSLAGELLQKMRMTSKTRSFASIVKKDPALQAKFSMAFGNKQGFLGFLKTAGLEEELNKLREITANSRTAMRTGGRDKGIAETMGEAITSGSVLAAGVRVPRAGARAAIKGSNMKAWERVTREMLSPGMKSVDAFLKAASDRRPYVPGLVQGITPAISSVTAERIKALSQR